MHQKNKKASNLIKAKRQKLQRPDFEAEEVTMNTKQTLTHFLLSEKNGTFGLCLFFL